MGEIRELTWEGVDLFRKTVTVFRSKNGERRTIPIKSLVLDVLKRKAKCGRSKVTTCSQVTRSPCLTTAISDARFVER